jgi:hypothetical protein
VEGAVCAAERDLDADGLLPAAERGEVRHRPVQACHIQKACHHPDRLPQGQAEQDLEAQAELDRHIREGLWPARLPPLRGTPRHLAVQPDQQRATPAQGGIVFRPIGSAIAGRRRLAHGRPDKRPNTLREHSPQRCATTPWHPQTQGKIERWHQTLKNRILLEHYYLPGALEEQVAAFVEHYNHARAQQSLNNLAPADVHSGRGVAIVAERARIKKETLTTRRLQHHARAA